MDQSRVSGFLKGSLSFSILEFGWCGLLITIGFSYMYIIGKVVFCKLGVTVYLQQ